MIEQRLDSHIWGDYEFEFLTCNATKNNADKIIAIWSTNDFEMTTCHKGGGWIVMEGKLIKQASECTVDFIYRGSDRQSKLQVYKEIKEVKEILRKPLLLVGDFNEILHPNGRKGQKIGIRV